MRQSTVFRPGLHGMCRRVPSAIVIALTPPFTLIVKQTPCVEAQITAHGSVHLMCSTGYRLCRLGDRRIIFYHRFMVLQFSQCDTGSDVQPVAVL